MHVWKTESVNFKIAVDDGLHAKNSSEAILRGCVLS